MGKLMRILTVVLIFTTLFSIGTNSCYASPSYPLGIIANSSFTWKVSVTRENIRFQLNNYYHGPFYEYRGATIKIVVKSITQSFTQDWEIKCDVYLPTYTYYGDLYYVDRTPSDYNGDFVLNVGRESAELFSAKPVSLYLSNCSANNPSLVANGTTMISYLNSEGSDYDGSSYSYRAEGEYTKGSGVLRTVKYYSATDELLYQYDLVSQFIPGITLTPFFIIITVSIIGIIIYVRKRYIIYSKELN
jgi:hypothetical protein